MKLLAIILALTVTASAQVASVTAEIAEAVIKRMAAKELAEVGGSAAVREVITQAATARVAQSLSQLPDDLVQAAVRAVGREPELIGKLVAQHGDDALIIAAKHPGVGTSIAEKLGKEGIDLAKQLPTSDAVRLARAADELATIAPAQRAAVFTKLQRTGGKALDYIERHPRILATSAGVAVFLAVKDDLLGTKDAPGFIERITAKTLGMFRNPLSILLIAIAALIFARVGFIIVRIVRYRRGQR